MPPSCSPTCRASMSPAKQVIAEDRRIPYDILVLATGAQHAYFGHDDWAPFAPGLKTIDDATGSAPAHPAGVRAGRGGDRRRRAGAAADLRRRRRRADRRRDGRRDRRAREMGACGRFPQHRSAQRAHRPGRRRPAAACRRSHPSLSEKARLSLEKLGVEVRLNAMVTACSDRRRGDRRASASRRARSCGRPA